MYPAGITVPNGGVLAPGNSAGTTTIQGTYNQVNPGATLAIEIGGTASGTQHDFVNVLGLAALGGNLQLAMLNGFVPSAASTFIILQATSNISGAFANVANGQRLATSGALGSFVVNYGPGSPFDSKSIVLSNFALSLPGDVNFDGVVDIFDVNIVSAHWGDDGPTGDANGDGTIDIFDINVISANWTSSPAPVPEPAGLALSLVAAVALTSKGVRNRFRSSGCRSRCVSSGIGS